MSFTVPNNLGDFPTHALSFHAPWAWAVVHGGKTVENRKWRTQHRVPIFVHAGRSFEYFEYVVSASGVVTQTQTSNPTFPPTPVVTESASATAMVKWDDDVLDVKHAKQRERRKKYEPTE